jgi:SAM-dependent methyltransferase
MTFSTSSAGQTPASTEDAGSGTKSYEIAKKYWEVCRDGVETFGVAGIGGGGLTEVLYRHHEEVKHFRRIVKLDSSKAVLELGSGNGRWAAALAPLVDCYVGVDFSEAMVEISRERIAAAGIKNAEINLGSVLTYKPSRKFDVIYFAGVSQYLHDNDLVETLRSLRHALNPGGVIVDRSTTHLHAQKVLENEEYFSLYRTAKDIVDVYGRGGLKCVYNAPSYRFLSFPFRVTKHVGRPLVTKIVAAFAPLSFMALKLSAMTSSLFFPPWGELLEFSHEFFVFVPQDDV